MPRRPPSASRWAPAGPMRRANAAPSGSCPTGPAPCCRTARYRSEQGSGRRGTRRRRRLGMTARAHDGGAAVGFKGRSCCRSSPSVQGQGLQVPATQPHRKSPSWPPGALRFAQPGVPLRAPCSAFPAPSPATRPMLPARPCHRNIPATRKGPPERLRPLRGAFLPRTDRIPVRRRTFRSGSPVWPEGASRLLGKAQQDCAAANRGGSGVLINLGK